MSSRGIPDSVGRACGSFRLQKSTSGAWPKARVRDERTRADGLAPSLRSRERRSVGSRIRAAKPERPVLGSRSRTLRASGESERTLVDGRHPESHEIARLDGPAVDVILAAEDALRSVSTRTGCQRSHRSSRPRKTTPQARGAPRGLEFRSRAPRIRGVPALHRIRRRA